MDRAFPVEEDIDVLSQEINWPGQSGAPGTALSDMRQ
jgi:hypothetical protein